MKNIVFLTILLLITISVFSLKIAVPMGPTLFTVLPIMERRVSVEEEYDFFYWKSFDEAIAMIANRQVSAIFLPVSYGATLFSKSLPVRLSAVTLWKSFFCISNGWEYTDIASLRDQNLYFAQGKGQTADVVMRILLKAEGLDPDTALSMKYLSPPEIVAFFQKGLAQLAVVPEPYASLILNMLPGSKIAFDLQTLWQETLDVPYRLPITGLFYVPASNESEAQTKNNIITIQKDFQSSTSYLLSHTDEIVSLGKSVFPTMADSVLRNSLTNSEYDFSFSAADKLAIAHYFETVRQFLPESLPVLPDENFYLF
ncbi:MAG: ABC transporter substrate-binding protein [Thermotogota bacterium]|nr:ABC transporter substrate-binding protein [Thermotogota bacterium]